MSIKPQYIYWLILFLMLGCVAIAKSISDESFTIFHMYAVPIWLWVAYLNYRKGRNLITYLKQHHRKEWGYLTYPSLPGAEGGNSFRTLPFIFSEDDLNDPEVANLKTDHKAFLLFAMVVFISIPLVFFYLEAWK